MLFDVLERGKKGQLPHSCLHLEDIVFIAVAYLQIGQVNSVGMLEAIICILCVTYESIA